MSASTSQRDVSAPPPAASAVFICGLLIVLQILQILVYFRSFQVLPAGDDFGSPMTDIHVARDKGLLSFLWRSTHAFNYRPLQSMAMWAAAELSGEHVYVGIRVLHFLSMIALTGVLGLWLWTLKVTRWGAVVGAAVLIFHPTIPQPLGSIDGFSSLLSTALLWFGAWCVYIYRDRFGVACTLALVVFLIGVGFKEYLFALAPLSAWVMLWFSRNRRWVKALVIGAAVSVAVLAYMGVRQYAMPVEQRREKFAQTSSEYVSRTLTVTTSPKQVVKNTATFVVGSLFPGNSVWAYLNRGTTVYAILGGSIAIVFVTIAAGLWLRLRERTQSPPPGEFPPRDWLIFLLVALPCASFPTILTNHVSEMYLAPVLFPLALLCGMAGDGFALWRGPLGVVWRAAAIVVGVVALGASLAAINSKVNDLVAVGRRADEQFHKLVAAVPANARGIRVMGLFLAPQLDLKRGYGVYRMEDCDLIGVGAFDWARPGSDIAYQNIVADRVEGLDLSDWDMVLLWDVPTQQFTTVKP